MINEQSAPHGDIKDMWDKETQEAYLKWAKEYGLPFEPWNGQPAVSAAWIAAIKWYRDKQRITDQDFKDDKYA